MARRGKSYNDLSKQYNRLYNSVSSTNSGVNPKRARVSEAFQNALKQRKIAPMHALVGKGNVKRYIGGAVSG
jgi:hypothetical protein